MQLLRFAEHPIWVNLMVFAGSAAVVWLAGGHLSRCAAAISDRTGIGRAFIGLLLLGAVTSLPEAATIATAAASGSASLAVTNILGSVALNLVILAVADAVVGRDALSSIIAHPVVLLQGALSILLLTVVAAGIAVEDTPVVGLGLWSAALPVLYVGALRLTHGYQRHPGWTPSHPDPPGPDPTGGPGEGPAGAAARPPSRLVAHTVLAAIAILAAGFLLARSGDALARQTGLGASFFGLVLLALSTSLAEVSVVLAAVRAREYEMAFSDIFGTNLFNVALICLADAVYRGGPVLNEVGRFSLFATLLGIGLTAVFLAGLIERRDRVVARMGVDSAAVIGLYLGGLVVLYGLR